MRRRLSGLWLVINRPPCVSESSSFCLFIKTDGKSWSFRLRRRLAGLAEGGKHVKDLGLVGAANAQNSNGLLVAVDLRCKAIANSVIDQRFAQRGIIRNRDDFSFARKVMISRSGDQHCLLLAALFDFDDRS